MKVGRDTLLQELFVKYGRPSSYDKGELIVQPAKPSSMLFCIQSGFVKSYDITPQGFSNLLFVHKVGEVFPLSGHIKSNYLPLFYQAMSRVKVYGINKDVAVATLNNNAALAEAAAHQVLSQLDRYTNRIQNLQYRTARQRLMFRLIELGRYFGLESDDGVVIGAPITHQDIADSINISRETVSRELQRLAQEGVLQQHKNLLIIKDLRLLTEEFT